MGEAGDVQRVKSLLLAAANYLDRVEVLERSVVENYPFRALGRRGRGRVELSVVLTDGHFQTRRRCLREGCTNWTRWEHCLEGAGVAAVCREDKKCFPEYDPYWLIPSLDGVWRIHADGQQVLLAAPPLSRAPRLYPVEYPVARRVNDQGSSNTVVEYRTLAADPPNLIAAYDCWAGGIAALTETILARLALAKAEAPAHVRDSTAG